MSGVANDNSLLERFCNKNDWDNIAVEGRSRQLAKGIVQNALRKKAVNEQHADNEHQIWRKFQRYPEMDKERVLREFRRKQPDNYYNKELLLEFLREKFAACGRQ